MTHKAAMPLPASEVLVALSALAHTRVVTLPVAGA